MTPASVPRLGIATLAIREAAATALLLALVCDSPAHAATRMHPSRTTKELRGFLWDRELDTSMDLGATIQSPGSSGPPALGVVFTNIDRRGGILYSFKGPFGAEGQVRGGIQSYLRAGERVRISSVDVTATDVVVIVTVNRADAFPAPLGIAPPLGIRVALSTASPKRIGILNVFEALGRVFDLGNTTASVRRLLAEQEQSENERETALSAAVGRDSTLARYQAAYRVAVAMATLKRVRNELGESLSVSPAWTPDEERRRIAAFGEVQGLSAMLVEEDEGRWGEIDVELASLHAELERELAGVSPPALSREGRLDGVQNLQTAANRSVEVLEDGVGPGRHSEAARACRSIVSTWLVTERKATVMGCSSREPLNERNLTILLENSDPKALQLEIRRCGVDDSVSRDALSNLRGAWLSGEVLEELREQAQAPRARFGQVLDACRPLLESVAPEGRATLAEVRRKANTYRANSASAESEGEARLTVKGMAVQISRGMMDWPDAAEYCSNLLSEGNEAWKLPSTDSLKSARAALLASAIRTGGKPEVWTGTERGNESAYQVDLSTGLRNAEKKAWRLARAICVREEIPHRGAVGKSESP